MEQLLRSIRTEMLKYKRTYALALAILAPLFITVLYAIIFYIKGSKIVKPGDDGVAIMLQNSLIYAAGVLFPLYLILLAVFVQQIEHRSASLKDLFSFPVTRLNTYLSKWTLTFMLLILSLSLYFVLSIAGAWIAGLKYPGLFILKWSVIRHFATETAMVFIASLFMMGIHFIISLKWSDIVIPFGIGFAGFLSAMILVNGWKHVHLHPYALGYMVLMAEKGSIKTGIDFILGYSLTGFLITFTAGYLLWSRRRIA